MMAVHLDASSLGATKEEFDNWIKLATDNKINASNSWDFALIDYFHDLSVLREGDGINFQKASATLDGCVKIYTSRIDSAATEIGRLLSGLATKKLNDEDEDGNDEGDSEDDDENGLAHIAQKSSLAKSSRPGTLLKSFKQIRAKTVDSQLLLDPVFKKTLTEFDEGGAKSLLMNLLHTDRQGRVLFDTMGTLAFPKEEICSVKSVEVSKKPDINLAPVLDVLKQSFPSPGTEPGAQLDPIVASVCPSMDVLLHISASGESLASILELLQRQDTSMVIDDNEQFGGSLAGADLGADTNEVPHLGGSFDISLLYHEDNKSHEGPNLTMVRLFNDNFIEKSIEASHLGEIDLHLMDYFDGISQKTWAGPEHWKISKLRQDLVRKKQLEMLNDDNEDHKEAPGPSSGSATGGSSKKDKEPFKIDFFSEETQVSDEELFKRGKNTLLPRRKWTSETYNLLPEDQQFTTKNFIYLSLKPKKLMNTALFGSSRKKVYQQSAVEDAEDSFSHIDENFYAKKYDAFEANQRDITLRNQRLESIVENDLQEIHQSFGDLYYGGMGAGEDEMPPTGAMYEPSSDRHNGNEGYRSQLVKSLSRFRPNTINFARVAKRVDVKLLKDNLWDSFNHIKLLTNGLMSTGEDKDCEKITPSPEMESSFKFTDIMGDIAQKYSKEEKQDLSTSFCFICLLHLANENGFVIENNPDYTDLVIHE